jgi:ligand-binding SRPBCC domain-containing protein
MPRVEIFTEVNAPIERVFDFSRSIDAHLESQTKHREVAVAGRTTGLIETGEVVTWEATHLGVRQRLTSRIVLMDRPRHFRDSMVAGAFKRFDHDHCFSTTAEGRTLMRDLFDYEAPLGLIGRLADVLFLSRYIHALLSERNATIKRLSESSASLAV